MRYRCRLCGEGGPAGYEFESDKPECPLCGVSGPPSIIPLVDIHFMVMNPKGPIRGSQGRQHVACEPNRAHLATALGPHYAATGDPQVVSCPRCKGTRAWLDSAREIEGMKELLEKAEAARKTTVDMGRDCCG